LHNNVSLGFEQFHTHACTKKKERKKERKEKKIKEKKRKENKIKEKKQGCRAEVEAQRMSHNEHFSRAKILRQEITKSRILGC
jgi:hypothetical protein